MLPKHIRGVLFDMAGTTVDDRAAGGSLVVDAFIAAFAAAGIEVAPALVHRHRGQEKSRAIGAMLAAVGGDEAAATEIYTRFNAELQAKVGLLRPIAGAAEVFAFLRGRGIRVGLGSGFPPDLVDRIGAHLGWAEGGAVDYVASAAGVGASRPDPAMVLHFMARCGIGEPRAVVKVGDTVADVQEGKNAGVWTVAVCTGSQTAAELTAAGADYVLAGVWELPGIMGEEG